jgi:DNA-binding MurR/RpiR family transcriptional regulator
MSCLIKIHAGRDQMSANDRKIADYLLQNSVLLRDYSSQQLAAAVGVSQSSIVKFCQKLGYKGYPDLKWAINEDVAISNKVDLNGKQHFDHQELNEISDRLLQGKLRSIRATIDLNEEKPFIEASQRISVAKRVFIATGGKSRHLANYLVHQLICLGKIAYHTTDYHYREQFLSLMTEGDAVIVLTLDDQPDMVNEEIKRLRTRQVSVISIGHQSHQAKILHSDINLTTVSDAGQDDIYHQANERAAQQHLLDILLLQLKATRLSN